MNVVQRLARLATDVVVRSPRAWPLFRRALTDRFDALAGQWDSMRGEGSFLPFEAALERVDGQVSDALDVGTGTGEGAIAVAQRFPDARVVGVDLSTAMLERARAKAPQLEFRTADAAALPFADDSFDLVTLANMIPFFDEIARVLRSGGWVLFAFSVGDETPIYVPPERLRSALADRGFGDFAELEAGRGTAFLARKR